MSSKQEAHSIHGWEDVTEDIADYFCKKILKESLDNPNTRNRCISNAKSALQHLSEGDRELLTNLVSSQRAIDDSLDVLEKQLSKTITMSQCRLVEEDEINKKMSSLKSKKQDLDEVILDLIIEGIGND